jgi:hypothetical protein
MDDLIFRQAVVNRLEEFCDERCSGICSECGFPGGLDIIRNFPSAQQWIPAHNIFPGVNGKYLVTGKHGAVNIIKYEDGRWYGGTKPIAWMPMPSPYREEDDHDKP